MGIGRQIARVVLALGMGTAGVLHFLRTPDFVAIVPSYLPWPRMLVLVSGVCEISLGVGLLIPRLQHASAWGLIALYVAVFPANVNMAIHHLALGNQPVSEGLLWARLPVQGLLIAWAYWVGRDSGVVPKARIRPDPGS